MATELTITQQSHLVFVEARKWQKNEQTNPMTFVVLADDNSYERFEFIAHKDCDVNFAPKTPIVPVFSLSNYQGRPSTNIKQLTLRK